MVNFLNFKKLPFASRAFMDDTWDFVKETRALLTGKYVEREVHEARVKELIEASNTQVELRRQAHKAAEQAEHDTLRAIRALHESKSLVKAVDYCSEQFKTSNATPSFVFDAIKLFCMGYAHKTILTDGVDERLMAAYRAGADAYAKDNKLSSIANAVGLMTQPVTFGGREHTV